MGSPKAPSKKTVEVKEELKAVEVKEELKAEKEPEPSTKPVDEIEAKPTDETESPTADVDTSSAGSGKSTPDPVVVKQRQEVWRDFISKKPGARFPPEPGRYHLVIAMACPWAQRTHITYCMK